MKPVLRTYATHPLSTAKQGEQEMGITFYTVFHQVVWFSFGIGGFFSKHELYETKTDHYQIQNGKMQVENCKVQTPVYYKLVQYKK